MSPDINTIGACGLLPSKERYGAHLRCIGFGDDPKSFLLDNILIFRQINQGLRVGTTPRSNLGFWCALIVIHDTFGNYDPTKSLGRGEFELASYNDLVGSISAVDI